MSPLHRHHHHHHHHRHHRGLPVLLLFVFVPSCVLADAAEVSMGLFDAGNATQMAALRGWYDSIRGTLKGRSDQALDSMLRNESCFGPASNDSSSPLTMCNAYDMAKARTIDCPSELFEAECKAIYMYSISNFSSSYSRNTRNGKWSAYETFNALLYSGVSKLAGSRPLPKGTVLYRGLRGSYAIRIGSGGSRFYMNQFTSTSYDAQVAEAYSRDTLLLIRTRLPNLSANLTGLTYLAESEVLVAPFEAFDYLGKENRTASLRSSSDQDFIVGEGPSGAGCSLAPRLYGLVLPVLLILLPFRS